MQAIVRILYPNALPVYHQSTSKSLVLLLGWAGSNRRNFKKILSFYESEGINVITHTMPFFVPQYLKETISRMISNTISKHKQPDSTFIIHSFSNNGIWTYGSLIKNKLIPTPDVLIIDSAPKFYYIPLSIYQRANSIARVAVSVILRTNTYYHWIWSPLTTSILYITIAYSDLRDYIKSFFSSKVQNVLSLSIYLRDESPVVKKTLFCYSLGDEVISSSSVHEFANSWRSRGFVITEKVFGMHVQHVASFYKETDDYCKEIKKLLA